jgi:hypothetical protein
MSEFSDDCSLRSARISITAEHRLLGAEDICRRTVHFSLVTVHVSLVTDHFSLVTLHFSLVTDHVDYPPAQGTTAPA